MTSTKHSAAITATLAAGVLAAAGTGAVGDTPSAATYTPPVQRVSSSVTPALAALATPNSLFEVAPPVSGDVFGPSGFVGGGTSTGAPPLGGGSSTTAPTGGP